MIENVKNYPLAARIGIIVYYSVGVIGLSWDATRPVFQKVMPFSILVSMYFLWIFHENPDKRLYFSWLIIFLLGYFVEVIGVNTGLIFGEYNYGESLGIKWLETPVVMGVNWLLLIYSSSVLVARFTTNRWLAALAGSCLMVLFDLALEPVAIRLDMWNWHLSPIPVQNYVAWFVISFLFFLLQGLFVKKIENKIAVTMFIVQLLFFLVINIILAIS
jgi:putative membrane protein